MELWYARIPMNRRFSVQGGDRPVVIVSNDAGNRLSGTVTALPVTTKAKRLYLPTHIPVQLDRPSVILAKQITTIDKRMLDRKIGDCAFLEEAITRAVRIHLGLAVAGEGEHENPSGFG